MKKYILLFYFLSLNCAFAAPSVENYQRQSTATSHIKAAGNEISAFSKKWFQTLPNNAPDPTKPAVLLVHGLWASPSDWKFLVNDLNQQGYDVYTISVSYMKKDGFCRGVNQIQTLAKEILETHTRLDFIGHSLGGVAVVNAVNDLREIKSQIKHVITINSPLNGTTLMNAFTRFFLPSHLREILTCNSPFTQQLRRNSIKSHEEGVLFFHTATESDHLVNGLKTCFLPQFQEGIIVSAEGHLSTLNNPHVRKKVIEWLSVEKPEVKSSD